MRASAAAKQKRGKYEQQDESKDEWANKSSYLHCVGL